MAIVRAIVAGERDGLKLAQFRDPHCQSSEESIAKALTGEWQEEHLFVLEQSLRLYDFYTSQLEKCDCQMLKQFSTMKPRWEVDQSKVLAAMPTRRKRYKNEPPLETHAELVRIVGVDLAAIGGIGTSLAQTILSEIGTAMSRWKTDKHFASWLGLAPHHDISGGKVLRSRTLPTNNRAGQAFRQAATAVSRGPTVFGAFYRRKRAQGGPQYAQVATAHKRARTVYQLLKTKSAYIELGAAVDDQKHRERELAALRKRAAKLGFTLSVQTPTPLPG